MTIKVKITRQENASYYGVQINDTIEINLTDYIAGVVASEMGNARIEAAKAQAVAARTFAHPYYSKGSVISDSSSIHQAFRSSRLTDSYINARQAAIETEGMVLAYDGSVINSCPYSNSNGGRTVSSKVKWGGYRAWLIEQDDPWDKAGGGTGNGHGVGMSQVGCHYAAKIGKTYEDILAFYYPGTTIIKEQEVKPMGKTIKAMDLVATAQIPYQERWGYIWGYRGQVFTQDAFNKATRPQTLQWGKQWIGKHVTDCSGQLWWSFNQLGGSIYHGSNTIWHSYTSEKKGVISAGISQKPGTAVFLYDSSKGSNPYHHVGLYIGDGKVVESRGTQKGVIISTLSEWDKWGELKDVDYSEVTADIVPASYGTATIRQGSRGESVKRMQQLLVDRGYLIAVDGVFGNGTYTALRKYQEEHNLTVDGVCGPKTWNSLLATLDTSPEAKVEDVVEPEFAEGDDENTQQPLSLEERVARLEQAVFGGVKA